MTSKKNHIAVAVLILSFCLSGDLRGDVISVCKDCEQKSVAQAVRDASDHDTIIVLSGTYYEHDIIIEKPLTLLGRDLPVINAEKKGSGFTVKHAYTKISGFRISNIAVNYLSELAGVKLDNVQNCVVEGNVFDSTFFAVYVSASSMCTVAANEITGNARTESSSGNGIHLWKSRNITLKDNVISGHRDGIYLEFVSGSTIANNISKTNLRYGLHFMFSDSNTYSSNVFEHNGAGVAVMYSKNIVMVQNKFLNNWGDACYGLLLKELYDGKIERNTFFRNTTGIFVEGSNRIMMKFNEFNGNGWAIKIFGNCYDNQVIENDFIGNTFDVMSNSSMSYNHYSSNYWDKYKGYDINKDGIGDVPFRPVSLFSMILEKSPESIMMLRSFIVDLLDVVERIAPSIIPETLVDEKPSISRIGYAQN